jgi:ankyrin repeat protein
MHKNIDGKTIFHVCCEKGLFRTLITILRCFIEKYNERQKDPESTLQDDISSIMKCRLNEPTTNEAYTALHLGVKSGHVELVRFLLSCTEIDIDAKDNYSKTALQYAQDLNATDIIALFPMKSAYGRRSGGIGFSRNSVRLQVPKDYDPEARRKSLNIQFENNPALLKKVEELVKKRERKRGVISYFFSKIKTSQ